MKKLLAGVITASCIFGTVAPTMSIHAETFESSVYQQAETLTYDEVHAFTVSRGEDEAQISPRAYRFHLDTPSKIDISTSNDLNAYPRLMNANQKQFTDGISNTTYTNYVNAGDYYIVYKFSLGERQSTTYNFKVSATPIGVTYPIDQSDNTDDDKATAHVIDPNSTIVGNVYEFDRKDWYMINIPSAGTFSYTFRSDFQGGGGFPPSDIVFYEENGRQIYNINNKKLNAGKLYICAELTSYHYTPGSSYTFTTSFIPDSQKQTPKPTTTTKPASTTTSNKKKISIPKAVLKKVKRARNKKSMTAKIKFIKGLTGYEYAYSTKKNFKGAKIIRTPKTTVTMKKLNRRKKYYVRVRCYKKIGNKYYFGKYSNVKKA